MFGQGDTWGGACGTQWPKTAGGEDEEKSLL